MATEANNSRGLLKCLSCLAGEALLNKIAKNLPQPV